MSVRWTYIDPATVFSPFIGFQTVLIALVGGAATLWGPLVAAIVFSVLAETLRLQLPQVYMMALGLLLILSRDLPAGRAGVAALAARTAREGAVSERPCSRRVDVSVRFGGLIAVDAVSATLPRRRAGRHHRPERRRQDHLLQRAVGRAGADRRRIRVGGVDLTGARPHRFARARRRPHVPDAARVRRPVGGRQRRASARVRRARRAPARGRLRATRASSWSVLGPRRAVAGAAGRRAHAVAAAPARDRHGARRRDRASCCSTRSRPASPRPSWSAPRCSSAASRDDFGLAVVWIEHAVTTLLRHVERVVVLHQGRTLADATPAEVVRDPAVIEAYLGDEMAEPA